MAVEARNNRCLVYSFGVHDSTEWEQKMAKEFGCDVYAFDPTSKFATEDVAPGVKFYKLGLQGSDVDVSQTHSALYDAIDPSKLRTLGDIRVMLGHTTRQVDVLRLDCEGCEWGVLKQLAVSLYIMCLMLLLFYWYCYWNTRNVKLFRMTLVSKMCDISKKCSMTFTKTQHYQQQYSVQRIVKL